MTSAIVIAFYILPNGSKKPRLTALLPSLSSWSATKAINKQSTLEVISGEKSLLNKA